LSQRPHWKIGTVCQDGIWINHGEKVLNLDYNSNIQSLLRNPKLDLLIAEYSGNILERKGMSYEGSNLVILDNPSQTERCLERDLLPKGAVIIKQGDNISVQEAGQPEIKDLGATQSLSAVYFQEIDRLLAAFKN
jgi:cyanophycin synthetase